MFINLTQDDYARQKIDYDSIHTEYLRIFKDSPSLIGEKLRDMELKLTSEFFQFAMQEWGKKNEVVMKRAEWFIPGTALDYESILDTLLINPPGSYKPPVYRQFDLLKKYLVQYRKIEKEGGWPMVYATAKMLKEGDTSEVISTIKRRLSVTGDYTGEDTISLFDAKLTQGVKNFQKRYGLNENGIINEDLIQEMNTNVHERIEQLIVNIERCKWVPASQKGEYLVVNLPEFKLHAYQDDTYLWNMNVVIGTATNKTVIFNGDLKYIVVNPYWNVPSSIITNEIIPKLRKDPSYLQQQQMELIKANRPDSPIDPHTIDWNQLNGKFNSYIIRQKPGPNNALGKIKFLFPNEYNIYLHDTPSKSLFERDTRSFSHGCIRLSDPEKLALFLLKSEKGWDKKELDKVWSKGKEKYIVLKKTVPVFIAYFTAWVDREGKLNFRDDIYQHDALMAKLLMEEAPI